MTLAVTLAILGIKLSVLLESFLMLLGFTSAALNMPPCVTVALTAKLDVRPDILRMVTINYLVTRGVTVIIPSTARILAPVLELVKTTSYRYRP